MVIRRGSIWWVDLGMHGGSEPGYRRPVLVVQSDNFNKSKIQTDAIGTLGNRLMKKVEKGLKLVLAL
jgi:mRNA interferase MazF